jgi:hypothetical protein
MDIFGHEFLLRIAAGKTLYDDTVRMGHCLWISDMGRECFGFRFLV